MYPFFSRSIDFWINLQNKKKVESHGNIVKYIKITSNSTWKFCEKLLNCYTLASM